MKNLDTFIQAHHLTLLLQRRMRQTRLRMPSPLDPFSSIIVSLIASNPEVRAKDLASFLRMPRSRLSILLRRLEEQNYLVSNRATQDGREKRLIFTPRGLELLDELEQLNNRIAEAGLLGIAEKDQLELAMFLSALADGVRAPAQASRKKDHPINLPIRRLMPTMGMLGKDYMKTGHDLTTYQILLLLFIETSPMKFKTINATLPFGSSKISRSLSMLVKQVLVTKSKDMKDRRSAEIRLTDSGRKRFHEMQLQVARLFQIALQEVSLDLVLRFNSILSQASAIWNDKLDGQSLHVRVAKTKADFYRARAFAVETLVRRGAHLKLPSSLLPNSSYVTVIGDNQKLWAVCEILRQGNALKIEKLFVDERVPGPLRKEEIIQSSYRKIAAIDDAEFLVVPREYLDAGSEEELLKWGHRHQHELKILVEPN